MTNPPTPPADAETAEPIEEAVDVSSALDGGGRTFAAGRTNADVSKPFSVQFVNGLSAKNIQLAAENARLRQERNALEERLREVAQQRGRAIVERNEWRERYTRLVGEVERIAVAAGLDLAEARREAERLRGEVSKLADEWDEHAPHADQPAVYEIHAEQLRDLLAGSSDTTGGTDGAA